MLKIVEVDHTGQATKLQLEGKVVGPWVEELGQVCERILGEGHHLLLDMADVSFADESGVVLLATLRLKGAHLRNSSPFLSAQLRTGQL